MDGGELESLIEEILVDTSGDDEQLWAFREAFEDNVSLPADALVIGEPVSVVKIDYDGNTRCGLTATCVKDDGESHSVALWDVLFYEATEGEPYLAAYRKWLGLPPPPAHPKGSRPHKADDEDIDLEGIAELIVMNVKESVARCRIAGTERVVTLRGGHLWDLIPGMIVTVRPRNLWRYAGHPYLSGEIESRRIDIPALNLVPLGLRSEGLWDPVADDYWFGAEDPIPSWARPIIEQGARPSYEMEQILPSDHIDDNERGLMKLVEADLRCLLAHSRLGDLAFDRWPEGALRHYEVGKGIGELSLGADFNGVLLWGLADNRPYLSCLRGYGNCLWRLGRFAVAQQVFESMLRLNPYDDQGVRFLLPAVRDRKAWSDFRGE